MFEVKRNATLWTQMRAALTFGPGDIRVQSMTDPVPESGEVLVKVGGCGICGGDYSGHKDGRAQTGATPGTDDRGA